MRRALLTFLMSLVWLIASPSLQLPVSGWVEVGVTPAAAEPQAQKKQAEKKKAETKKQAEKKPVKKPATQKAVGSPSIVTSTQPGFHPMQTVTPPQAPEVTGTVVHPRRMLEYPNVPTVPAIVPETSQDRIARCTHQGALGGLPASEQGTYIHKCAF